MPRTPATPTCSSTSAVVILQRVRTAVGAVLVRVRTAVLAFASALRALVARLGRAAASGLGLGRVTDPWGWPRVPGRVVRRVPVPSGWRTAPGVQARRFYARHLGLVAT